MQNFFCLIYRYACKFVDSELTALRQEKVEYLEQAVGCRLSWVCVEKLVLFDYHSARFALMVARLGRCGPGSMSPRIELGMRRQDDRCTEFTCLRNSQHKDASLGRKSAFKKLSGSERHTYLLCGGTRLLSTCLTFTSTAPSWSILMTLYRGSKKKGNQYTVSTESTASEMDGDGAAWRRR